MKTSLRSYIFFFLLLLLASMSLSFFMFFRFSAREYINAVARQQVTQTLRTARERIEHGDHTTLPEDILLYDQNRNLTHPQKPDKQTTELASLFRERYFKNRADIGRNPFSMSTETRDYLLVAAKLEEENPYQAAFVVSYTKLYNDEALLRQVEGLVLLITLLLALIFTPLLWIFSGRLVKPLRQLQQYSIRLGSGDFKIPRIPSAILEIEDLSATFSIMAQELGESIEAQKTFFQNASHELRTPLMSIVGYAQAIQDGIIPDHNMAAEIIIRESERMKLLIDDILTLARLDAKEQVVSPVSIDIRDYLSQLIERLQGIALSSGQTLLLQTSVKDPIAFVDPILLEKVCANLVANALQHARHCVYIELTEQNHQLLIAVENDGEVLQEEETTKLFRRFYKGSGGNFGIGLSIVKSAAEYMGGTVSAGNGIHGARFVLTITKANETALPHD